MIQIQLINMLFWGNTDLNKLYLILLQNAKTWVLLPFSVEKIILYKKYLILHIHANI